MSLAELSSVSRSAQRPRGPRVAFQYAVRVTPLGSGIARAYRVLSSDLSRGGIFLQMPVPLAEGTPVALSLEARGQVLPFAQGEVAWRRTHPLPAEVKPGFGVRFTSFLNPRADALIDYLVERIASGAPLRPPARRTDRRIPYAIAAGLIGFGLLGAGLAYTRPSTTPIAPLAVIAPKPVVAAPVEPVEPVEDASPSDEVAPPSANPEPLLTDALTSDDWLDQLARTPISETAAVETPATARPKPAILALHTKPVTAAPVVAVNDRKHPLRPVPVSAAIAIGATRGLPLEGRSIPLRPRMETEHSPQMVEIPSGAVRMVRVAREGHDLRIDLGLAPKTTITKVFPLDHPARLAIDLKGPNPQKTLELKGVDGIGKIRVGHFGDGTRLVLDLEGPVTVVKRDGNRIELAPLH